jgi:hypothetical protein
MESFSRITVGKNTLDVYDSEGSLFHQKPRVIDSSTLFLTPTEAYQDFMGVEFGKVGPWDAPYNTQNPRTWNGSDIYVPFQVDYLTGNSGCDDVIIETRVAREKSEYLQEFSARFDDNVGLAIQGNTQNRELSYIVYDIMGKTIAQGITSESSISISASTISGLRKGTYLITLRELNTNNPPHTIRINKL